MEQGRVNECRRDEDKFELDLHPNPDEIIELYNPKFLQPEVHVQLDEMDKFDRSQLQETKRQIKGRRRQSNDPENLRKRLKKDKITFIPRPLPTWS